MKSEKFVKLRWLFSDLPGNCDLTILFCNFPQTGQVENPYLIADNEHNQLRISFESVRISSAEQ